MFMPFLKPVTPQTHTVPGFRLGSVSPRYICVCVREAEAYKLASQAAKLEACRYELYMQMRERKRGREREGERDRGRESVCGGGWRGGCGCVGGCVGGWGG